MEGKKWRNYSQEKIPITDPNYYGNITKEDLTNILRGDDTSNVAPMIEERVQNLQQVGRILVDKYNGKLKLFK